MLLLTYLLTYLFSYSATTTTITDAPISTISRINTSLNAVMALNRPKWRNANSLSLRLKRSRLRTPAKISDCAVVRRRGLQTRQIEHFFVKLILKLITLLP